MTDEDGFRIEAAMQFGFEAEGMGDRDDELYQCHESQLIAFAKACERAGMAKVSKLAKEIAAKYDPQNSQENALAGELLDFARETDERIAVIDAELAPILEAERVKQIQPDECEGCGQDVADPPSTLCPTCQAYREHQS